MTGDQAGQSGSAGQHRAAIGEALRFGVVGAAATATHAAAYLGWGYAGVPPMAANLLAFCIAVIVSFVGHSFWTFPQARKKGRRAGLESFARFAAVALCGLALNTLSVYVVVRVLGLPSAYAAIPMLTAVPLILFLLSRSWAFAPERSPPC